MKVFAIDPGDTQSAYLQWEDGHILDMAILPNDELLSILRLGVGIGTDYVVEGIASYGMPVGKTVFETCYMIGRILEITGATIVYRKDIKMHLCGTTRAKDSNIRQALIDRFGEPGTKKAPGLLYGVKKDIWSALAITMYYIDVVNP